MNIEMKYFAPNGKEVSFDEWAASWENHMVKSVIEQGIQNAAASTEGMLCPTHGKKATLEFSIEGHEVNFKVTTCCDKFAKDVRDIAQNNFFSS